MSTLSTVLGLITLGKGLSEVPLFKRALSGVVIAMTLTIITGMMVSALLVGVLWGLYQLFMANGMDPAAAALTTGGIAVFATIALGMLTLTYMRKALQIPRMIMQMESPLSARASGIADAFIDGLMTRQPRRK